MSVSESEMRRQRFMLRVSLIGWLVSILSFACLYFADEFWWIFHEHEIANILGTAMILLLGFSAVCIGAFVFAWARPRKVLKVKVP